MEAFDGKGKILRPCDLIGPQVDFARNDEPNVTRKGMIYRRGQESKNGPYMWDIQYPVLMQGNATLARFASRARSSARR